MWSSVQIAAGTDSLVAHVAVFLVNNLLVSLQDTYSSSKIIQMQQSRPSPPDSVLPPPPPPPTWPAPVLPPYQPHSHLHHPVQKRVAEQQLQEERGAEPAGDREMNSQLCLIRLCIVIPPRGSFTVCTYYLICATTLITVRDAQIEQLHSREKYKDRKNCMASVLLHGNNTSAEEMLSHSYPLFLTSPPTFP
jgi:hypothetical protein